MRALSALDLVTRVGSRGPLESERSRRDLAMILERIPYDAVQRVGFESRLNSASDRIDYFLGFSHQETEGLRRTVDGLAHKATPAEMGVLEGLRSYADRWGPNTTPWRDVRYLWLEYDGDGIQRGRRPPGVFLETGPQFPTGREMSGWMSDRCLDIEEISGFRVPEPIATEIARCLDECPGQVVPGTVGFFLGRPHAGVRLCLAGFDLWGAKEYLKCLRYEGDLERFLKETLAIRANASGIIEEVGMLHVDVVNGGIGPRVGLELVFEVNRQMSRHRLDMDILDALADRGLASPHRNRQLAAWPGAARGEGEDTAVYLRRVNHLKLVFDGDRQVEAKAYFGIRRGLPRFVPRESIGPLDGHQHTP